MQRVAPDKGDAFGPVKEALWDYFLQILFQGEGEGVLEQGVTPFQ